MQGRLIFGAFLTAALSSGPAIAAEQTQRPTCSKAEQSQQAQQSQQRPPHQVQQQQRARPQNCPVTRMIPSVVDPTPTFLL